MPGGPSAGTWHGVTLRGSEGRGAAASSEGRGSENPPASARVPDGAAKGLLAERSVTQLSARRAAWRRPACLHQGNLLF